ncbi:unnamed protein product, partial [Owenia fusiformis]
GKYKLMIRKGKTTAPIKISATAKLTKNMLLTVRKDLNEMILTTTGIFPPHIINDRTQLDVSINIENESNASFMSFMELLPPFKSSIYPDVIDSFPTSKWLIT